MATNNYQNHLLILPEDDAYRRMANGFLQHSAGALRNIKVDKLGRGWNSLLESFSSEHVPGLQRYKQRHVLLLLDLDEHPKRYEEQILPKISADIQDRVIVLSCRDEAEAFKKERGGGKAEDFGMKLATSCYDGNQAAPDSPWLCSQLEHNKKELCRLAAAVRSFLFY